MNWMIFQTENLMYQLVREISVPRFSTFDFQLENEDQNLILEKAKFVII